MINLIKVQHIPLNIPIRPFLPKGFTLNVHKYFSTPKMINDIIWSNFAQGSYTLNVQRQIQIIDQFPKVIYVNYPYVTNTYLQMANSTPNFLENWKAIYSIGIGHFKYKNRLIGFKSFAVEAKTNQNAFYSFLSINISMKYTTQLQSFVRLNCEQNLKSMSRALLYRDNAYFLVNFQQNVHLR